VATGLTAILILRGKRLAVLILAPRGVASGTCGRIGGRRERRDIRVSFDSDGSRLRVRMALNARFHFRRAVVAIGRRDHGYVAGRVGKVFVRGNRDRRPGRGTRMTRSARRDGCDEVRR